MTRAINDKRISNGDQLRNVNCYEYLKILFSTIKDTVILASPIGILKSRSNKLNCYVPSFSYGDLYTYFFEALEARLKEGKYDDNEKNALIILVNAIYGNRNNALHNAAELTKDIVQTTIHTTDAIEKKITAHLNFKQNAVNKTTPQKADSVFNKLPTIAVTMAINATNKDKWLGKKIRWFAKKHKFNYKPMFSTGMTSIIQYDYQNEGNPTEIRMGTQAEYHEGKPGVNAIFKFWIENLPKENGKIKHVYFNCLGRNYDESMPTKALHERIFESKLTKQIELLEKNDNIAVITLPADKGLMNKLLTTEYKPMIACNALFSKILSIASGQSNESIKDFFISDNIKKMLYDENTEEDELSRLLTISFKKILGEERPVTSTKELSQAEIQAVYFHFIKYELTNFILEKLKPRTFNISCKDGIDRGGIASTYYNLIKSIEIGKPLAEPEFNRALHAPATLVKGRGINHHSLLIWNAIDSYIKNNSKLSHKDPKKIPDWLIDWRDKHAPEKSKCYYINLLNMYIKKRNALTKEYYSYFFHSIERSKSVKISAAEKLKAILENKNPEKFSIDEYNALQNSELEKIFKKITKAGIDLSNYKPIQNYSIQPH